MKPEGVRNTALVEKERTEGGGPDPSGLDAKRPDDSSAAGLQIGRLRVGKCRSALRCEGGRAQEGPASSGTVDGTEPNQTPDSLSKPKSRQGSSFCTLAAPCFPFTHLRPSPRGRKSAPKFGSRTARRQKGGILEGRLPLVTLPGEVIRVDESLTPALRTAEARDAPARQATRTTSARPPLSLVGRAGIRGRDAREGQSEQTKKGSSARSGLIRAASRVARPLRVAEAEGVGPVPAPPVAPVRPATMTSDCRGFSGCSTKIAPDPVNWILLKVN